MLNLYKQRYAMVTVDTEALPHRALNSHVDHLIWGKHNDHTLGITEICALGNEFNAPHVFFVDLCSRFFNIDICDVVRWLGYNGQDVQLHAHPETLPEAFWLANGLETHPFLMNEYKDEFRASFVVNFSKNKINSFLKDEICAFRSWSFRWNASLISSIKSLDIPLSFNNSMRARLASKCSYSVPTNYPFYWSNGVIEIPLTERLVPPQPGGTPFWASLTFPESPYFPFQTERKSLLRSVFDRTPDFKVLLLHSWSLLDWDENGHAYYRDDQRLEVIESCFLN